MERLDKSFDVDGPVRFEPPSERRSRVHLTMEYEPRTAAEKLGDLLGLVSRNVDRTVEDFRRHVERRGRPH